MSTVRVLAYFDFLLYIYVINFLKNCQVIYLYLYFKCNARRSYMFNAFQKFNVYEFGQVFETLSVA